jgi:hypothetical protein
MVDIVQPVFGNKIPRLFNPGQELPQISTNLDSVRAYQFEVQFEGLPTDFNEQLQPNKLAQ